MAISTPTVLTTTVDQDATATSSTTTSISPSSDCLLVVAVTTRQSAISITISSLSTTLSNVGSWTIYQVEGTTSQKQTAAICWAKVTGSPGSGTITVNYSNNTVRCILHTIEITGHNTTTPVKQNKTGTNASSTLSLTLDSSPDSDSLVLGVIGSSDDSDPAQAVTPGTNYTELNEADHTTDQGNQASEVEYDLTPTSTTVDWSNLSTQNNAAVAVEIDAAGADVAASINISPSANYVQVVTP